MAWSNPELIELSERFVPAADEVWRLHHGDDFECRLFRRFSEQGHYTGDKSTRQGIYVVTPNGRLLGSTNTRLPDRIERLLRDALARWSELATADRSLTAEEREELAATWRWSDAYPADGLVLESITRDLPRDGDRTDKLRNEGEGVGEILRNWTKGAWNRDWVWFRADEAKTWVPEGIRRGAEYEVPRELVERLVRFHLVDSVRGQTIPYDAKAVERAELTVRVVRARGAQVELELSGATRAAVEDGAWPRSFEATLEGSATWDRKAERFTAFELVAAGTRTGHTRFNEREDDRGPAPIGVVMRLAAEDAPRIAPTWIHAYGWARR